MSNPGLEAEETSKQVSEHGSFDISLTDDGYYLTVFLPKGEGIPITEAIILEEIKKKRIKDPDYQAVLRILRESSEEKTKIAPPPEPEVDPIITILVSRDRMEATLQIEIPKKNARKFSLDEVYAKIEAAGIIFGLDRDAIELAYNRPGIKTTVACGQTPEDGKNAFIKYLIDLENKGRPAELDDGSVDYKDLSLFTNVAKEQPLAEKMMPTLGIDGIDVLGQAVLAKQGKDIPFPLGKNVTVSSDNKIVASIAGQFIITNNKLNVIPVIEIKEDVDLSTGNIEFIGSVIVRGSVQTGFSVKAEENVEIMGSVGGGTIEGKNVIIRMGVQGMNTGYIRAKENVTAKFLENAAVYAGQDIIVGDVVLHSNISAGRCVIIDGRRGQVAGGRVIAGEEIRAKIAGTHRAPNTDLEVGVNPMLREEFLSLRKEVKKYEYIYDQTIKGLSILRSLDQVTMQSEKKEMLLKMTKAQFQIAGQLQTMRNRLGEIELAFEEMRYGKIKIKDIAYPGVKIVIGSLVKPLREITRFVTFYSEDGEIKLASY